MNNELAMAVRYSSDNLDVTDKVTHEICHIFPHKIIPINKFSSLQFRKFSEILSCSVLYEGVGNRQLLCFFKA
jgi:hypothetical protein